MSEPMICEPGGKGLVLPLFPEENDIAYGPRSVRVEMICGDWSRTALASVRILAPKHNPLLRPFASHDHGVWPCICPGQLCVSFVLLARLGSSEGRLTK